MNVMRVLKWAAVAFGAVVGVVALVLGLKFIGYSRAVARAYDVPPLAIAAGVS